jgi:ABC-type bacteriocin/lantibiotic exporter with double-glycine peptidase domain
MVLASFVQGKISLDRIQEFMGAEELDRFHSHDGELPSLHASTSAVSSILLEDSNDAIDRDEHSNDGNVSSTQLLALKESLGVRLLDSDVLPVSVSIKKANFSWQADQPPFLVDIDLNVPVGKLAVIIGRVGSGKCV